jgi:hypothetical protein
MKVQKMAKGWAVLDGAFVVCEFSTKRAAMQWLQQDTARRNGDTLARMRDVKPREYIRRTPTGKTYARAYYDRFLQRYCCVDTTHISRAVYLRGDDLVYVGFTY